MMRTVENPSTGLPGADPAAPLVFSCDHGRSTCYVIPGSDERRNRLAIELVRARHVDRVGCACRPEHVRIGTFRALSPAAR